MASTLDGITVLDLTSGPAGALATMFLCDHGARVIRVVDTHDTVPRHRGYLIWDRGKECLRLDLAADEPPPQASRSSCHRATTSEDPTDVSERLLRRADVLIEDLSHPRAARPWCPPTDCRRSTAPGPLLDHRLWQARPPQGRTAHRRPGDGRMGILGSQPGFRPAPVHVVHPLPSGSGAARRPGSLQRCLRESNGMGRTVETSLMAGALLYHPKLMGEKLAPHTSRPTPPGARPSIVCTSAPTVTGSSWGVSTWASLPPQLPLWESRRCSMSRVLVADGTRKPPRRIRNSVPPSPRPFAPNPTRSGRGFRKRRCPLCPCTRH